MRSRATQCPMLSPIPMSHRGASFALEMRKSYSFSAFVKRLGLVLVRLEAE